MEEPSNYNNYDEKYKESIKFSMDSGNYFKDAFSWYSLTYIQPIVDRTLLLFASIISIFIIKSNNYIAGGASSSLLGDEVSFWTSSLTFLSELICSDASPIEAPLLGLNIDLSFK